MHVLRVAVAKQYIKINDNYENSYPRAQLLPKNIHSNYDEVKMRKANQSVLLLQGTITVNLKSFTKNE